MNIPRTITLLGVALATSLGQLSATEETEKADLVILVSHTRTQSDPNLSAVELERMVLAEDAGRLHRWVPNAEAEGGWTEVTADEGILSLPFSYNGPQTLTLYTRVLRGEEPPNYIPREKITLPKNIETGILFALRTGGTDKNPSFRLGVIDCSSAPADEMGVLLYNLTQSPLIASVGKNNDAVPLKPSVPEWNPLNQKRSSVPLRLAAFDEEWKLIHNSVNRLALNRPTVGLILPGSLENPTDINLYLVSMPVWPSTQKGKEESS